MEKTERTKSLERKYGWLTFFHLLCLFGPLLIFTIIGFSTGTSGDRITLSLTAIVSIILALISTLVSTAHKAGLHRTILWIMILGIMYCLKEVEVFIWVLAVTGILDELVFIPLARRYKNLKTINKEIDLRG